ncbi:MAG: putative Ig domain-containing protein, partial [Candidatus Dormibacteria bacterium]
AASCTTTRLPVGSGTVTATYSGSVDYTATTAEASDLVVAPLTITTTSLPQATLGQAYSFPLTASGGTAPLSWTVTGGSLPQGLSLSPAGVISGVPSSAGVQPVTISVRDASSAVPQQAAAQFQLTVQSATSTPGSVPDGAGGASTPSTGAGGGGAGGAVASSGRTSAAPAVALSWWDAVGVVVLALLAALGIVVGRRHRAR